MNTCIHLRLRFAGAGAPIGQCKPPLTVHVLCVPPGSDAAAARSRVPLLCFLWDSGVVLPSTQDGLKIPTMHRQPTATNTAVALLPRWGILVLRPTPQARPDVCVCADVLWMVMN